MKKKRKTIPPKKDIILVAFIEQRSRKKDIILETFCFISEVHIKERRPGQ